MLGNSGCSTITIESHLVAKCSAYTLSSAMFCNFSSINLLDPLVQYLANVLLISTPILQHITQPLHWVYCYLIFKSFLSIITNDKIDQQAIVSPIKQWV